MAAYAGEFEGKVNACGKVDAEFTGAFQEAAAYIGLRTQSIRLMRDGLYRLCEGYMNGALDKETYEGLMRRYQRYMVALLGIEQLTRFKLGTSHDQVLVTNLPLQPLNLWRFSNDRTGVELRIKQLKGDDALGSIPTRHFMANETCFHLLLFAYNLMNWFKRLCLPPEFQHATLQTLWHQILLMPAMLRRTDKRPCLALPANRPRGTAWHYALHQIERLKR